MKNSFLPVSGFELKKRNIDQLDFIFVSGDAYVDHPTFAHALLGRWLSALGYSVGILAQPDWNDIESFKKLGQPKHAFLVSPGNLDSMVNIFSVNKRRRKQDVFSAGGKTGKRPKRSSIVYTNRLKEAYPYTPVIIGGIEPSLRRFAHYDYWDNEVRRSILFDSDAALL